MEEFFDMRELFLNENNGKNRKNRKNRKNADDFLERIAQETDGKIPNDVAKIVLQKDGYSNKDKEYVILLHRCLAVNRDAIFRDGLRIKCGTDLDYTTSNYTGSNITLMISIRDAHAYKNPNGEDAICVIIKIPKEYLEYEKGITKPILFPTEDAAEQSGGFITLENKVQTILLPEFILGAIEYSDGKITGFTSNERYKDEHDYLGDGLVFPDDVLYDYYKETGTPRVTNGFENLEEQRKQDERITEIIIKQGNEYEMARRQGNNPKTANERTANKRTENEVKEISLREMPKSRFKTFLEKFKSFFKGKDNSKEKTGGEFNDR